MMDSSDFLISRLNLYKNKYCIFVGAGISICSGVPLATYDIPDLPSIVSNIRKDFYSSLGLPPLNDSQLFSWFVDQKLLQNPATLYSDALNLIGDTPRARQHYLRRFFDNKKPGKCHQSISRIVENGYIDILLTTNFDSLLEDALRANDGCSNPKVAAHTDAINDILLTEPGPKIAKLHGDYLFSDIKNTEEETRTLTDNMRNKLRSVLGERGLLVIGYSGNDNSVMSLLEQMGYDGGFFPYGLYWIFKEANPPGKRVKDLIDKTGGKLLPIYDAESLLLTISKRLV